MEYKAKRGRRLLALLMTVVICLSVLPFGAFSAQAAGSVTLVFESGSTGGNLVMSYTADAAYAQKYYLVDTIVDGNKQQLLLELGPGWDTAHAYIYGFPANTEFEIAAGTTLYEADGGWNLINDGLQLTAANTMVIKKSGDAWVHSYSANTPTTELAVDTAQGAGGYMGSWAYNGTVSSVKLVSSPVVGGGAWLTLYGQVNVAGTPTDVVVTLPDNGEWWFGFDSLPSEYSVSADAVFVTADGIGYSFTKDLTVNSSTGATYTDPVIIPLDKELVFHDAANDNWRFTVEDVTGLTGGQWYTADITVDGAARTVLLEYCEGVGFYIYSHCFGATPGSAACPASSVQIAVGTVLTPISTPDASAVIAGGQTLRITEEIHIVKQGDAWGEYVETVVPLDKELVFHDAANDNWRFTVADVTGLTAGQWYTADITVDGAARTVLLEYCEGAGFYIYNHCFGATPGSAACPASSVQIAAGTVLTPISTPDASAVVAGGQTLRIAEEIHIVKEGDAWVEYVEPIIPLDKTLTFANAANNNWLFTIADVSNMTAGQWYTADITVDGAARTVLLEYCEGVGFYIYNHCFGATPGSAACPASSVQIAAGTVLTPISTPDASAVIVGGQTLALSTAIEVVWEYGAWYDQGLTYINIDMKDSADTIKGVNYNAGAGRTWIWMSVGETLPGGDWTVYDGSVTVSVDGTNVAGCAAQKLDDAGGKDFQIMITGADYTSANQMTIAAGSTYSYNGTVIRFVSDFVIENTASGWKKEQQTGWLGANATLSGNVEMGFFACVKDDPAATVTFAFENGVPEQTLTLADATTTDGETYRFEVEIVAAYMSVQITATLKSEGNTYVKTYSVKDYGEALLAGDYSAATKKLANAMLNYGGYAQDYFETKGQTVPALRANAGVDTTLAEVGDLEAYRPRRAIYGTLPTLIGYSLILEDETTLRLYISGDVDDGYTYWCNGTELVKYESAVDGRYFIQVSGINSLELFTKFDFKAFADGELQGRWVLSPMTYVRGVLQQDAPAAADVNLMKAIYAYNLAAQQYDETNYGLDISW
ncbi:MAG: hypothetical protein IJE00_07940 [Clostridia bacterium]|nr:hypothetical protein [Clostridia bacterium]